MTEAAGDDRREQMLRAAIDVIAERGFPETRISDIGRRVGASSALVIYYFGTKDRLLTDALRYSEDLFYAEAERRLDAIEGARDKVEALVRLSCSKDGMDGLPGSWLLWPDLWAQAVRHPEVSQHREELDQRWRDKVADIVRAGVASGEFDGGRRRRLQPGAHRAAGRPGGPGRARRPDGQPGAGHPAHHAAGQPRARLPVGPAGREEGGEERDEEGQAGSRRRASAGRCTLTGEPCSHATTPSEFGTSACTDAPGASRT